MSTWIILAFLAPFFWSCANYVDKFIISRYVKVGSGAGSLVIFTGLTGFVMSAGILLLGHGKIAIPGWDMVGIMIAGMILVASFIPYLSAMRTEDSTVVVPLYQLIPVFTYILAFFFLGETLSLRQIIAGVLIIIGAVLISINPSNKFRIKKKVLGLMTLSSLGIAVNYVMFKWLALDSLNPWATAFWEYIGAGIFSIFLFVCIKRYRQEFTAIVKNNGPVVMSLNIGGEVLNLSAKLLMVFASLSVPIALVNIINGVQPFIIFFMGLVFSLWIPHIIKENITPKYIVQRVFSIIVLFVGIWVLFC